MCSTTVRALYAVLYSFVAIILIMALWLVLSTDMLMRPTAIHYDDRRVTFVRETPFGDVWGVWSTEIRVTGTGEECSSGRNRAMYQVKEDSTVTYYLGPWADRCLEQGPPLVIVDTWQALLLGVIPLRPVRITTVIEIKES